ncbi:MAG: sorbosone dehydrogenase family protein, partial [Bacteroidota bacterium]
NRTKKSGYQVVVGCPDKQNRIKKWQPFLTGFLEGKAENTLGRPTDLIFDTAGALLVSDDHAGHIWRVEMVK